MRQALILVITMLLVGCSSTVAPINYYLLDPVAIARIETSGAPIVVEIVDIDIPQYLERFQIATRSGTSQLKFSDENQWGENLRKNLLRTMSRNLSDALGTIDIASPIGRTRSRPDFRVQVYIEAFERGSDGRVHLSARWQLSAGASGAPMGIREYDQHAERVSSDNDYPAIVGAMRELYGELCLAIAKSIVAAGET